MIGHTFSVLVCYCCEQLLNHDMVIGLFLSSVNFVSCVCVFISINIALIMPNLLC